jgi:hypothetical protein
VKQLNKQAIGIIGLILCAIVAIVVVPIVSSTGGASTQTQPTEGQEVRLPDYAFDGVAGVRGWGLRAAGAGDGITGTVAYSITILPVQSGYVVTDTYTTTMVAKSAGILDQRLQETIYRLPWEWSNETTTPTLSINRVLTNTTMQPPRVHKFVGQWAPPGFWLTVVSLDGGEAMGYIPTDLYDADLPGGINIWHWEFYFASGTPSARPTHTGGQPTSTRQQPTRTAARPTRTGVPSR